MAVNLDYRVLLGAAKDRIQVLEKQRESIDAEIAALEQSIRAFEPLLDDPAYQGNPGLSVGQSQEDASDIGLTDAIRAALKSENGRPLTSIQVRDLIVSNGFSLVGRANAMANVHQVLKRLVAQGEVEPAIRTVKPLHAEGNQVASIKTFYAWRENFLKWSGG